jgi:uncharacterized Zn-binding protein involved in type VI secretion
VRRVARETDGHMCPRHEIILPHVGGPIVPAAWLGVEAEGQQAARLADYAECFDGGIKDVVFEGAATVLVGGLPFAVIDGGTAHEGGIETSASTVWVGGPIFSLPPNIVVKGDSTFQNQTIRDLYFLSTLPSGRALLQRLADSGETVTIVPSADPSNSSCSPADPAAKLLGIPTGSTIAYNPAIASTVEDENGMPLDNPPQAALAHEMVHAMINGDGTYQGGVDPSPPPLEPDIPQGEAAAIGAGSHANDYPTENSVRNDMGLQPRNNHNGWDAPAPTGNQRPGGY